MKVERRRHPRGEAGTRLSLWETARKAAEGRLDPKTRAWTIEQLVRAGNPQTDRGKAEAILGALRESRIYVEDPIDSDYMPSSACTLAGCDGLTFLGEDCDGLNIAFLSACGSVGLEIAVIGAGYPRTGGAYDHTYGGVWDRQDIAWLRADPSDTYPLGQVSSAMAEIWIHVPNMRVMCDGAECVQKRLGSDMVQGNVREHGDFVGVGRAVMHDTGYLSQAEERFVTLSPDAQQAARPELLQQQQELASAMYGLAYNHATMLGMRSAAGLPVIDDPATTEASRPAWTSDRERSYQAYMGACKLALQYLSDAAMGGRQVMYDSQDDGYAITGAEGEAQVNANENGELVVYDGVNTVTVGVAQSPVVVGLAIVCGAAVAGIAAWKGIPLWQDIVNNVHKDFQTVSEAKLVKEIGTDKYIELRQKVASAAQQQAAAEVAVVASHQPEPVSNVIEKGTSFLVVAAVVGIGALLVFSVGPKVAKSLEERKQSRAAEAA